MLFLTTHEQTTMVDKNERIRNDSKIFLTWSVKIDQVCTKYIWLHNLESFGFICNSCLVSVSCKMLLVNNCRIMAEIYIYLIALTNH